MGKLVFQITGAFAEFERSMIRSGSRQGSSGCCSRHAARTAQGRCCPGAQGAKAAREGRGYPEGRQDARTRDRNGPEDQAGNDGHVA
jgi:hypothetical protein